jgi:hypothetical protein
VLVPVVALVVVGGGIVGTVALVALRDRAGGAAVAVAAVVASPLLLVVAVGGVGMLRAGTGDEGPSGAPTVATATAAARRPESARPHQEPPRPVDVRDPSQLIALHAGDPGTAPAVPVVAGLRDGDVLRLRVDGLRYEDAPSVRQCRWAPDGLTDCRNAFPVTLGDMGEAVFQYQLDDAPAGGDGCGPDAACVVVVGAEQGPVAVLSTVFGAPAPGPVRLDLASDGPHEVGTRLPVVAHDLPAGARVGLAFCSPRCRAVRTVTVAPDGTARATLDLTARCEGRCVVAVLGAGARGTSTPVHLVAAPTPDHQPGRIAATLAGAALLLAVAWLAIGRTDWRPPSEAATPELDAAEL